MGNVLGVREQVWVLIRQCYLIKQYLALAFLQFLMRHVGIIECTPSKDQ